MSTLLEDASDLLARLTRGEKACVLKWLVDALAGSFPGIQSIPGVCGGEPCVVRTRIPVWTLVRARQLGVSDADILSAYPSLNAEDLAGAWAYARFNPDEVDRHLEQHERA